MMMDKTGQKKIRCAIYTRKSTEEGLDQEFNSLDAQYEACASYIKSQKHEGWRIVRNKYDDGGISGGTMERGGLKRLLLDIEAGLIDMVVVYKIDRLTRSLSDFSKIVDQLDASGASFVSVTQSFNTATSMGRLTLNMLLSFAQFEREVTSERIRDKIAASKAKGMWMGGIVPLGYDIHPDPNTRSLVINKKEAEQVSCIFEYYQHYKNLRETAASLEKEGIHSKIRKNGCSTRVGGKVMTTGQIHYILTNPIYIGKIKHKDQLYDGMHDPLIEKTLWDEVQSLLQDSARKLRGTKKGDYTPWLKGKLFDETDDHLTPTHTKKKDQIIRYYISNRLISQKDPEGWRLPAKEIEGTIREITINHLNHLNMAYHLINIEDIGLIEKVKTSVQEIINRLKDINMDSDLKCHNIIEQVHLSRTEIRICLNQKNLYDILDIKTFSLLPEQIKDEALIINQAISLQRRRHGLKIIMGEFKNKADPKLTACLLDAHRWLQLLKEGYSYDDIAEKEKRDKDHIIKRIKMALLSPKIQNAIMTGQHPLEWSIIYFIKSRIPDSWDLQEKQFL